MAVRFAASRLRPRRAWATLQHDAMNRPTIVLMLLLGLAATAGAESRPQSPAPADAAMPPVVSTAWLATHLADPGLVVLHVGDPASYAKQHIVGARQVDLADISILMPPNGGLHLEMLTPDDLRHRLEALGIQRGASESSAGARWITAPCGMPRLMASIGDLHRSDARFLFATWKELDWDTQWKALDNADRLDIRHKRILPC